MQPYFYAEVSTDSIHFASVGDMLLGLQDTSVTNTRQDERQQEEGGFDIALTGKTLLVYRHLVTIGKPSSAREVQRALKLSGPSIAQFHLEKLAKCGLVKRNESDGAYIVDRVHLKHYFLLRQRLIPKYFLYATLATFSIIGWMTTLFLPGSISAHSFVPLGGSLADFFVFIYGITLSTIFAIIFWRETLVVLRKEKI